MMQSVLSCPSLQTVKAAAPAEQRSSSIQTFIQHTAVLQRSKAKPARILRHATRAAGSYDANTAMPGLKPELKAALDEFIAQNKIVLFMKGTQQFPQCGFSNTCVQIFRALDLKPEQFTCVNILEDDSLRSGLKEYSSWPTFPQVYIDGEFFGGCDIMIACLDAMIATAESFQSGELQEVVERVLNS